MRKGGFGINNKARSLLLLLFVPLLTGCWDRVEMNDVAFFMASSLDVADDGRLLVSIQIPLPAAKGDPSGTLGKTYFVLSAEGTNIYDAERKCQQLLSRKFFKGHRRVVFIGEAFARKGIKDIMDYYARDPGTRLRTYLVVAKGRQGMELTKMEHPFERIPAEEVRELEYKRVGEAVTFRDFMIDQGREGIVPVLGAVDIQKLPANTGQRQGDKQEHSVFRLSSTAVMKDYKLVGYLDDIETRSLRWIRGELKHEYLAEQIPDAGGSVGVILNKTGKKIKTVVEDGKAKIRIKLTGEGLLQESTVGLNINRPENVAVIEKGLNERIEEQTLRTVEEAQTVLKSDVFGFGLTLHQYHYGKWQTIRKDWDAIFANAEVSVEADIRLKRAGMIGASVNS